MVLWILVPLTVIISLIIELIINCFDRKTVADLDAVGREKSQAFRLQPQKKERERNGVGLAS
jgi:hypothetical protein